MIRLIPNSWGTRRVREFNDCNLPEGESDGGRFGSNSDPRCGGGGSAAAATRARAKGISAEKKLAYADARANKVMDYFAQQKAAGAGTSGIANPLTPADTQPGAEGIQPLVAESSLMRPEVIQVETLDEAVEHVLAGHAVEVADVQDVNTLIEKLAAYANDAAAKGEKAPTYDLCNVSVQGTNLFCHEKLRNAEYPEGVPRVEMPQMKGKAIPGSQADTWPKAANGEVDGTAAFIAHLKTLGINVDMTEAAPDGLKASQAELVGSNVAWMMTSPTFDPAAERIFVARDGYIVDGHHRWAASVGKDANDGVLGDNTIPINLIDAPITEVIAIANKWSKDIGIAPKSAGKPKERSKQPKRTIKVKAQKKQPPVRRRA